MAVMQISIITMQGCTKYLQLVDNSTFVAPYVLCSIKCACDLIFVLLFNYKYLYVLNKTYIFF